MPPEAQKSVETHEPMPAATQGDALENVEARAQALVERLRAEKNAPAEETEGEEAPAEAAEATDAPAESEDEPEAAAAEAEKPAPAVDERKEALRRAAELERNNQRAGARLAEREARQEARERELANREAAIARFEAAMKEPSSVLEFVSKHVPPGDLADYIVQSQKPEVRAEWAAKKAAREAHPEVQEALNEVRQLKQQLAQERMVASRIREEQAVVETAKGLAEKAPYAAALADRKPQKFLARVHATADSLRARGEELSYERIVQEIEADLADDAPVFAPKTAVSDPASSAPTTQAAASKARTLSARTTAGRSTVGNDDEKIAPLEDRAALIKQQIARGTFR